MDRKTFDTTIISQRDSFFRVAKSILQDADEASDVVQDVLLKLWEMREDLLGVENPKAFAFRSLRNRCLDIIKLRKNESELDDKNLDLSLNPYELIEISDAVNFVQQLIESLPEMQRSIIRMRDVEGMEIAEIADIMVMNENAIYTNLSRARTKIKELMIKHYNK